MTAQSIADVVRRARPRRLLRALRRRLVPVNRRDRRGDREGPPRAGVAVPAPQAPPAVAAPAPGTELARRMLAASATVVVLRDRAVLAVVAGDAMSETWRRDANVQRLRPDDALAVFATVTADALVVDPAAGALGPWGGLGTYAAPQRDLTVLELLSAARDRGVPSVLCEPADEQTAPMLLDAVSSFTRVVPADAPVDVILQPGPGAV